MQTGLVAPFRAWGFRRSCRQLCHSEQRAVIHFTCNNFRFLAG